MFLTSVMIDMFKYSFLFIADLHLWFGESFKICSSSSWLATTTSEVLYIIFPLSLWSVTDLLLWKELWLNVTAELNESEHQRQRWKTFLRTWNATITTWMHQRCSFCFSSSCADCLTGVILCVSASMMSENLWANVMKHGCRHTHLHSIGFQTVIWLSIFKSIRSRGCTKISTQENFAISPLVILVSIYNAATVIFS